jgi:hypothetical protein
MAAKIISVRRPSCMRDLRLSFVKSEEACLETLGLLNIIKSEALARSMRLCSADH